MGETRVTVTLDDSTLRRLDRFVAERRAPTRGGAILVAIREKLRRARRARLARECAKLNPVDEKNLAEEAR